MNTTVIMSCFEGLKDAIRILYSENSMADTEGQINLLPVLRECDKMECVLEGDMGHYKVMVKEDGQDSPIPSMKISTSPGLRQRKSAVVKWAAAKGRVAAAREVLDALIAEEKEAKAALDLI